MKTLPTLALCATLFFALLQPTHAEVEVTSGGTGEEGLAAIKTLEKDYSFKATFIGKNGDYLSDIGVEITDAQDHITAKTTTDGPVLLARLEPGHYTLHAKTADYVKTQKVTIGAKGLKEMIVRFPLSAE